MIHSSLFKGLSGILSATKLDLIHFASDGEIEPTQAPDAKRSATVIMWRNTARQVGQQGSLSYKSPRSAAKIQTEVNGRLNQNKMK